MTDREALLAKLLADSGFRLGNDAAVPRRDPGATVPLSSAQQRLWFLDRLADGASAYLMPLVRRITGPLDVEALSGALAVLVARHEALRAGIIPGDDAPVHRIAEPAAAEPIPLALHDLGDLPPERAQGRLAELLAETTGAPFDLTAAPLARAALIRLSAAEHVLAIVAHHVICDDVSLSVIGDEVMTAYRAIARHQAPDRAEPAVRFGDFLVWEAARPAGRIEHWVDHLAGAPPLLALPTDRPRPAVRRNRGATLPVAFTPELTAMVRDLARRHETTPFVVLLAALSVLLGRHADTDDVVVGAPVARRDRAELESVVGMFVNTVALRTRLDGDPTLTQVLQAARATALDGLEHADVPLDAVIERLQPPRELSYTPLFQVMLVVNPAAPALTAPALQVEPIAVGATPARFDLTLLVTDSSAGLRGQIDYDTDLFDEATVRRFAGGLCRVLQVMATAPDTRVGEVALLDPVEFERLSAGPAGAGVPSVLPLIDRQIAAHPDGIAVLDQDADDAGLTYAELDRRSTAVARRLTAAGVRPEDRVGLALRAGADAVVGLLGILRAGAAFVPLDPTYPRARLDLLTADAGARLVVTDQRYATVFDHPIPVGGIADPGVEAAVDPGLESAVDPVWPTAHPDALAYVVYTSGSTGTPKGVMVSHAALANLAVAFRDLHGFDRTTRLLMVPPLTFDAALGDVFPVLISGGTLATVADPATLTATELERRCRQHSLTAVDSAAALWHQWVPDLEARQGSGGAPDPAEDRPAVGGLGALLLGGEQLSRETLQRWARLSGGVPVFNHYGPTEATVCALTHRTIDGSELGPEAAGLPVPCGRPLPGVRAYVLNRSGHPCPVGVVGELFLSGAGLARGYLGDPVKTAAAFRPDPFSPDPGSRMYRTGDLALWRPNGTLEFRGRADRQVKIRGHRVELGEVEAAIARHPDIRDVAVVATGDPARLVGYVTPAAPDGLRAELARVLPDHLVPNSFVGLEALPLTAHGKIDVAALPDPAAQRPAGRREPLTPTETAIAGIWSGLLGGRPGLDDNYFDLGGHSLQAATVVEQLRLALGVRLTVRELFEAPDLQTLAARVDQAGTLAGAVAGAVTGTEGGTLTGSGGGPSVEDLLADAELPPDICAELDQLPPPAVPFPGRVLVTGATGKLGSQLVLRLLQATDAEVTALVRADSDEAAADRLLEALRRTSGWDEAYAARLEACRGDLARPRMGVADYDRLAERIDTVLHSASLVNVVLPYTVQRAHNVHGVLEVLRFAGYRRVKPAHIVSTLGTFFGSRYAGTVVTEADVPADPTGINSPNAQTKWVADALARAAAGRGLPVSLYRPALIVAETGHTGPPADSVLARQIASCVALGCAPDSTQQTEMTPSDVVAAAIVALAHRPHGAFHLYNMNSIPGSELGQALREHGFPIETVPRQEWLRRADAALSTGRALPAGVFAGYEFPTQLPEFDCRATFSALAGAGVSFPATADLLRAEVRALVDHGVLPSPEPA